MAEVVLAIGLAASIVSLLDFGAKVISRIDEFQSTLDEVPKSCRNIKVEFPLLVDTLKKKQNVVDLGSITEETQKALLPVIRACSEQPRSLDTLLDKALLKADDSRNKRHKKIVNSLQQEGEVEKVTSTIRSYIQTLTYYHAAVSSTLEPLKGVSGNNPPS
ncbi:hypothetical protein MMC25_001332 [Agyrium rufum]|nr:hypothetical protein [Agyrium rufum]